MLGVAIEAAEVRDILVRLEMDVSEQEGGWLVRPPSCRFDITIEEDLIEEVGRIYGYERIPTHRGAYAIEMRESEEALFDLERAKLLLVGRDYQEVVTYSFVSPELADLVDPQQRGIPLANPISADMSVMRSSLWSGLLQTAQYNQSRQIPRVRIFESGLRFQRLGEQISQPPGLAGLVSGGRLSEQWSSGGDKVDFYDMKGDVEALLELTGAAEDYRFGSAAHPALHPGQTAGIYLAERQVGIMGMLHPELERRLDLNGSTYLFELELPEILQGRLPGFESLSKYPSIRRDIAIVVENHVTFESIRNIIREAAGKIIKDIRPFDVYTGGNIDSGRKSVALGLILQEKSHTLTDSEVDEVVQSVLHHLSDKLDAKLRD